MLLVFAGGVGISSAEEPSNALLQFDLEEEPPNTLVRFDQAPVIETDQGFAQLSWQPETAPSLPTSYELQRSQSADFAGAVTLYQGKDQSSFVSGLPEGKTWFRVRATTRFVLGKTPVNRMEPFSAPVMVEVKYVSLDFVFTWLIVGGVVFLITLFVIVGGHLNSQKEAKT